MTCFFHVDKLGLGSVANSNLEVQTYLHYLWGLALVPADKEVTVWETFIQDALPLCDDEEMEEDPGSDSMRLLNTLKHTLRVPGLG